MPGAVNDVMRNGAAGSTSESPLGVHWTEGTTSPVALASPLAHTGGPGLDTVHVAGADMASPIRRFQDGLYDNPAERPNVQRTIKNVATEDTAQLAAKASQLEAAVRRMEALRAAAGGGAAPGLGMEAGRIAGQQPLGDDSLSSPPPFGSLCHHVP